ncbi:MAG: hypothetical protein M1812_006914 [Candelaria pacifica]|nr:MAG: hypothetical protein M1812_006914 [Candelaria pacifica]
MARPKKKKTVNLKAAAAAPQEGVDAKTAFPFLKLPPELRNMIYRYLLVAKDPIDIGTRNAACRTEPVVCVAILRVSRQTHIESAPILYSENRFYLLIKDKSSLPLRMPAIMKHLEHLDGRIYHPVFLRIHQLTIEIHLSKLSKVQLGTLCKIANVSDNIHRFARSAGDGESMLNSLRVQITEFSQFIDGSIGRMLQRWKVLFLRLMLARLQDIGSGQNLEFGGAISPETAAWAKDWIKKDTSMMIC